MVWSLLAFTCKTEIALYQQKESNAKADILQFQTMADRYSQQVEEFQNEIAELNKRTVNTTAAKDSINALTDLLDFKVFSFVKSREHSMFISLFVKTAASPRD